MKRLRIGGLIVYTFLLFACAMGKPEKQIPRHLSAGPRQINKGLEWYQKGCYGRALEYFYRAHELYSASDVLDGVAMSLNNIGTTYRAMGDCEAAVSFFDEAYAIYSDLHDQEESIKTLSNKAATLIHMGNLNEAEQIIEEAYRVLPSKGNRRLRIPVLQNKGVLLTKKGAYKAAEEVLADCLDQADNLDLIGRASLQFAFGNLMLKTGRPADAIASFEKALSIDRKLGFYRGMADDLFHIGLACARLGQDEKAATSLKRSIKIFALIDLAEQIDETMRHLKEAAQRAGVDISLTEAFVERWRQGKLYESPCGD